jgi:transposase
MSEKRRSYDKEFKLSAVKMITEGGMSLMQVSRDLGVNENSLHKWKKDYLSDQQPGGENLRSYFLSRGRWHLA